MTPADAPDALRLVERTLDEVAAATDLGASGAQLLAMLTGSEAVRRHTERIRVHALGAMLRQGFFAEQGYRRPAYALPDLLGCDHGEGLRLLTVAELVCERVQPERGPDPGQRTARGARPGWSRAR